MRLKIIAIVFCLLTLPAWAAAELLYPLKAQPSISSGFGQYRIGHPHGGVDLWTFLKIGTPVLAADDGVIYEIRCSSVGYGRVLYHRLRDGRIAVYAHLNGFAPKIDAVARKIQQATGRFSFSKSLAAGETIAVQRGEVIGFAGDSGTDVAHLHFEIRDRNGMPVNPLRAGFPFTDTMAPLFAALHLEPLTFDAHVDGRHAERIVSFSPTVAGAYRLPEIVIGGRVGLSVHAFDRANGTKRHLPPYDLSLFIDERPWFEHRFDWFDYNDRFVSNLSYLYRLQVQRRGTFIRLFRRYERTVFHPTDRTGDLSTLTVGRHEAHIVVRDEAGNRSEARFPLLVRPACRVDDVRFITNETGPHLTFAATACRTVALFDKNGRQWPLQVTGDNRLFGAELRHVPPGTLLRIDAVDASGAMQQYRWRTPRNDRPPVPLDVLTNFRTDWQEDRLLIEADGGPYNRAMPTVRVFAGRQPLPRHWLRVDNNRVTLTVPLDKGVASPLRVDWFWAEIDGSPRVQSLDLPFQTADGGRRLISEDGGATIDIPRGAMFRPLPVAVRQSAAATPTWLRAVSPLYTFSGQWTPLRNTLALTISPPPGTSTAHTGVYLYDNGTWWHLEAGPRAKIPTFGSFALLRDIAPPQIGKFFAGKKRLKVMVSDQGSGIKENGIRVLLDGRAQIFEYMPFKNQFVVEIGNKLPPGAHRLDVTVNDRAGNAATATFSFNR